MNQYSESKEIREKEKKKSGERKRNEKMNCALRSLGGKSMVCKAVSYFIFLFIFFFFLRCFPVTRVTDWAKKDRLLVVLSRESEGF